MSESQIWGSDVPLANHGKGWCLICNEEIDPDIESHFAEVHTTPDQKPRTDILSWDHRLGRAIAILEDVQRDDDPKMQIAQIDEVLLDLYVVRARLGEKFRDKIRPKGR